MDTTARFIFEGAVDDQRSALGSISPTDGSQVFNAQFLHRDAGGFSFQTADWPDSISTEAAGSGLSVTFQFAINGAWVQFLADARSIERKKAPGGANLAIVRCSGPTEFTVTQRRAQFRAVVPPEAPLAITAWKIPPHWVLRDRPKPSAQLRVELIDISSGGACLKIFQHRLGLDSIANGDRLRAELRFGGIDAVFDGKVVWTSPQDDGSMRIGVAFQKLENTIEGRRGASLIDHAIAALQRHAIQETADATV